MLSLYQIAARTKMADSRRLFPGNLFCRFRGILCCQDKMSSLSQHHVAILACRWGHCMFRLSLSFASWFQGTSGNHGPAMHMLPDTAWQRANHSILHFWTSCLRPIYSAATEQALQHPVSTSQPAPATSAALSLELTRERKKPERNSHPSNSQISRLSTYPKKHASR